MRTAAVFTFLAFLAFPDRQHAAEKSNPEDRLEIGMAETMFPGLPKALRNVVGDPFISLLKRHTGLSGNLNYLETPQEVAAALDDGRLQIAVLYGHEFGWVAEKYPDQQPLLVATPAHPFQTYCVVRQDSPAKSLADLPGQKIAVPLVYRAYSSIFMAKQSCGLQKHLRPGKEVSAPSSSDAIFNVIEGNCGCAAVDAAGMRLFEATYPGPSQQVRVLCKSEEFPSACILVKRGTLDPKLESRMAETLLQVEKLPGSELLLDIWKIRGFQKPEDAFVDDCRRFGKDYPANLTAK